MAVAVTVAGAVSKREAVDSSSFFVSAAITACSSTRVAEKTGLAPENPMTFYSNWSRRRVFPIRLLRRCRRNLLPCQFHEEWGRLHTAVKLDRVS